MLLGIGVSLDFRGLYLCSVGIFCNVEWCIRHLLSSSITPYYNTSILHKYHTHMFPLLCIITSSLQVLLKAALGAGGFGLYFCTSSTDCIEVLNGHARKALSEPGFVEKLKADYNGSIPKWSLQSLVHPVRVHYGGKWRKSQVRKFIHVYACISSEFTPIFIYTYIHQHTYTYTRTSTHRHPYSYPNTHTHHFIHS